MLDGGLTPGNFTGIISTTSSPDPGAGNGGSLTVNVDDALSIAGHAEIASGTFSTGVSGDVFVNAETLTILGGTGLGNPSGIFAQTGSSAPAGLVTVNVAGAIRLAGTGGNRHVNFPRRAGRGRDRARAKRFPSMAPARQRGLSGIESTAAIGSTGPAGSVDVGISGNLALANGAVISSASNGSGRAAACRSRAAMFLLMGSSAISASAVAADAGTVGVRAANTLSLTGGSSIETTTGANGGDITLTVGQLLYLLQSQLTAQAGLNGGNITIGDPQFVALNQSRNQRERRLRAGRQHHHHQLRLPQ